jgi:hypothetical protein
VTQLNARLRCFANLLFALIPYPRHGSGFALRHRLYFSIMNASRVSGGAEGTYHRFVTSAPLGGLNLRRSRFPLTAPHVSVSTPAVFVSCAGVLLRPEMAAYVNIQILCVCLNLLRSSLGGVCLFCLANLLRWIHAKSCSVNYVKTPLLTTNFAHACSPD